MIQEANIEAYLLHHVRELGGVTAKMTIAGQRGWPDRLVALPGGKLFLVELKKPKGGALSDAQKQKIAELAALGTEVQVLKSFADVVRFIKNVKGKEQP